MEGLYINYIEQDLNDFYKASVTMMPHRMKGELSLLGEK